METWQTILLSAGVSIIATIATYFVTTYFTNKREKKKEIRKEKMTIFKTLMAKRGGTADYAKLEALNSVCVIFSDEKVDFKTGKKPINESYKNYISSLDIPDTLSLEEKRQKYDKAEDLYIIFLENISKHLKIAESVDWQEIKNSYRPQWVGDEIINRTNVYNLNAKYLQLAQIALEREV
ncbi:MAG: hypothetical protein LBU60_02790 [Clostridiales bacterium]|jgi:hypothetical protein|nr:hypothetical protein [Clostridiales bacterium]